MLGVRLPDACAMLDPPRVTHRSARTARLAIRTPALFPLFAEWASMEVLLPPRGLLQPNVNAPLHRPAPAPPPVPAGTPSGRPGGLGTACAPARRGVWRTASTGAR